jgi:hypothetical protein
MNAVPRCIVRSVALAATLCSAIALANPDPWLIPPDGSSGRITKTTSETDLIQTFGKRHVVKGSYYVGEDIEIPGTILYPDEPATRLELTWKDKHLKRVPEQVHIYGEKSLWHTAKGITLGTSLNELELLNGRPFRLVGFDIDYQGTVLSWNGGLLEKDFKANHHLTIRLKPPLNTNATPEELASLGGAEFSSDNATMKKVNPRVYEIVWVFQ